MKVNIVAIGNSKGVRIPKSLLEQCKFNKEAELEVKDNVIILKPARKVREGWSKRLKLMHERKEDSLLINDALDSEMLVE